MNRTRILVVVALLLSAVVTPVAAQDDAAEIDSAIDVAVDFLAQEYTEAGDVGTTVTDAYTSEHNGVTHVYVRQTFRGLDVLGAEATVNVLDDQVVYAGDRFVAGLARVASGEQIIGTDRAIDIAAENTDMSRADLEGSPTTTYRLLDDGRIRLVHNVQLVTSLHWYNVSVDAQTGEVVYVSDWVDSENAGQIAASTARPDEVAQVAPLLDILPPVQAEDGSSYNVYPIPMENPLDGDRRVVNNPAAANASPFGWHDTNGAAGPEFTTTRGNNTNTYADTTNTNSADPASQPNGGTGLDFDHPIVSFDATPASYRDAAVDNLFYWNNIMHDVTFGYGFNEEAGNFQQTNYSGLGRGDDAVNAEAQDGSGALNANFATPADGSPGRMQMYLWVDAFRALGGDIARVPSTQSRDGDLSSGVIAHEYGHGISNRLVGGPSNADCLRTYAEREGEGWSDWWSYALTMRPGDDGATPRGIGNYVTYYDAEGRTGPGIRITPYSTDMDVNPSTYNTIRGAAAPHGVGYVWASMLWDAYWNLVEEHGFNPNPYDSWDTGGNNLAIQLVIDGMKFAPCSPGFTDARDALISADAALTGDGIQGENYCLLWSTFARRGLGVDADQGDPASKTDGVEGYEVPAVCA